MSIFNDYTLNKPFEDISLLTKKHKKQNEYILSVPICLDTETSHNHNEENPKTWLYQWGIEFNGGLYYGRTPEQLIYFLNSIIDYYGLNEHKRVIIFVHNLSYDYSYLPLYLYNEYDNPTNVLATDERHIFMLRYNSGLEFRCSYKLSNKSLDKWARDLNTRHKKLVGTIDYDLIRNQTDKLYKADWKYLFYDCIVLSECIIKQLEIYNDTLKSIPYTSTGYVRREIQRSYKGTNHHKSNGNREKFIKTRMYEWDYLANRLEFSGGLTIGNILLRNEKIKGTIRHRDFRSAYPSKQRTMKFAMGQWLFYARDCGLEQCKSLTDNYCVLLKVYISNVALLKGCTAPYLQASHCRQATTENYKDIAINGRVIKCTGGFELCLFYEELHLILSQYHCGYKILECYINKKDYLPKWLTDVIDKHFKNKSDKKDTLKKYKDNKGNDIATIIELETDLMKSKNVINGIYGVSATDPVRENFSIDKNVMKKSKMNISEALDKFYGNYNSCMRYSWGCLTTMYVRMELMYLISEIIGYDNFIYSDTDSIFYISTPEIEEKLEEYNKKCYDNAISIGAYITTDNGKIINYSSFDDEEEDIIEFKYLHSKCYAYVTADGQLHSTIAGVQKYGIDNYPQTKELGSIDNLEPKKVFTKCGGTKAKYISEDINDYNNNSTCGGCIITRTTKTLTCTDMIDREDLYYVEV